MNTTRTIKSYGEKEIAQGATQQSSWHDEYRHSSYIFIANLNYGMNEGDIAIVFSQFGETVDVHLVRDKVNGKSKGFCFLAYEDQRSTVLAVDNFNHADVCGRLLRVDHVREFKPPKEYYDLATDDPAIFDKLYKPSGPDGKGWGEFRELSPQELQLKSQIEAQQKEKEQRDEKVLVNLQELQKAKGIVDEDERWEKMLMIEDEKQIMKDKIQTLQEYNQKMTKYKPQEKQVMQETNQEKKERLEKQKEGRKEGKKQKKVKKEKEKKQKKQKHQRGDSDQ